MCNGWSTLNACQSLTGNAFASNQNGHACTTLILQSHWRFQKERKKIFPVHSFLMAAFLCHRISQRAFKYVRIYKKAEKKIFASEDTTNWDRTIFPLGSGLTYSSLKSEIGFRTSLVAQWLRIRLPMQGTRAQSLVREDPTCRGAPKPLRHIYWACALEPVIHNYWALVPQLLKPVRLGPVLHNKRSHRNEKPVHRNEE